MFTLATEQIECTRYEAVALETVYGILAEPYAYMIERSGKAGDTWVVRERVQEAVAILNAARLPETSPESPRLKSPDHPFLACLYALEAHATLVQWSENPRAFPNFLRTRGKLCRLLPKAKGIEQFLTLSVFNCADLRHAAALIVAGFVPGPHWSLKPGCPPAVSFSGSSRTFPEIPRAAFKAAALAAGRNTPLGIDASKIVLGSHDPGEHPWCYAIQALANAAAAKTAQRASRKNPVLMQRGAGQRSSIVSLALMEESCRDSSLRDAVLKHNKGL